MIAGIALLLPGSKLSLRDVQFLELRAKEATRPAAKTYDPQQWCPHQPWPQQKAFLQCDALEVLYGGAAGGAKTDALLMRALKYVDVPGYSALILRRDYPRLNMPGAIMNRARQWLYNTPAKWNGDDKRFTFPSGATIQFGYIDSPEDRFRYQSAEFSCILWDELTEFRLTEDESNPYLFLFNRLRKTRDIGVPLQMCAASNPGNIGHAWVKRRFLTPEAARAVRAGVRTVFDGPNGTKFVPAAIRDNPSVDAEEYERSLEHLPPVARARLMQGDWDISDSLVIPPEWLRRYDARGDLLDGGPNRLIDRRSCRRFATIDTAGTSKDKADAAKGRGVSWSVVAVWDYWSAVDLLFLRHVWRARVEWTELRQNVLQTLRDWQVATVRIENAHVGPALRSELATAGFAGDVQLVGPVLQGMRASGDGPKLDRAVASGLIRRLEAGKLLIPQAAVWLAAYEHELTSWGGLPDETADQIDVSSYAAAECRRFVGVSGGIIGAGGLRR